MSFSKRYLPNPAWGPTSLQRWVRWSPIFLRVSPHMEVVLPEVTDAGVYAGRTQSMQTQKGLVQILLLEKGGFHSILGFTPLILRCFCMSRERAQPHWFCIFKRRCVPSCFSLTNLQKKKKKSGPHPPEPHRPGRNRSKERGRCQRSTDACWPGGGGQAPPIE